MSISLPKSQIRDTIKHIHILHMPQLRAQTLLDACMHYEIEDQKLLHKAISLATEAHEGQIRKSNGLPYIIHPLDVALDLENNYKDPKLTISAILHDVVEDNKAIVIKRIYQEFGKEIGFIVDSMTKGTLSFYGLDLEFASYRDKFLYGGIKDVRVFLVKLSDRKNNLETLHAFREVKQMRISFETQALYIPLKKILKFGESSTPLPLVQQDFETYAQENQILKPRDLENHLYSYSFNDFTHALFDEVYSCSENVVWEIRDITRFEEMLQNEEFNTCTQIISCEYDGRETKIRFKMTKPLFASEENVSKFSITGFSQI